MLQTFRNDTTLQKINEVQKVNNHLEKQEKENKCSKGEPFSPRHQEYLEGYKQKWSNLHRCANNKTPMCRDPIDTYRFLPFVPLYVTWATFVYIAFQL